MKLVVLLTLGIFSLVSTQSIGQDVMTTKFSPEQLKEDLQYFIKSAEEIHPNLYHSVSKESIDFFRKELEAQITDSMTALEFIRLATPLSTKFKDGHTLLWGPYARLNQAFSNAKRFPLKVKIVGRQIFVFRNYSHDSSISIWDEIVEINGIESADLIEELMCYINGELEHWRLGLVENRFEYLLWLAKSWEDEFRIEIKRGDKLSSKIIPGLLLSEINPNINSTTVASNYSFSFVDGGVGLIDFRSMFDTKQFKKFLDSTFQVLNEKGTKHLIIDVRNNGGGNSNLAKQLFYYLTDQPFRLSDKTLIKTSKIAKEFNRKKTIKWYMYPLYPLAIIDKNARAILLKRNGSLTEFQGSSSKAKKNLKNKFKGEVYLLTGTHTFSSAHMLASAFSYYNLGEIIGSETGQPIFSYGALIYLKLPNTRSDAWISSSLFMNAGGDQVDSHRGVLPDYKVVPTIEDIKSHKDAVLEFTLKHIRASK